MSSPRNSLFLALVLLSSAGSSSGAREHNIRSEYRPVIKRELTSHEAMLWTFKEEVRIPDVLAIKEPSTEPKLYQHSEIDEEAEGFYKSSEANYFTNKFKKEIEKEQTWGTYLTSEGVISVKPLERVYYWGARELIKSQFIPKDPLWSWFEFEKNEESYRDVLRIIKDWLTSAQSVIALNLKTKHIHGVALGCYNEGTYLSKKISQVQVFDHNVTELMNIRRLFQKRITASLRFWNNSYYQIELMCTDNLFPPKQALLRGLINGCEIVSKSLNVSWLFGLSTQKLHSQAYEDCNFEKVSSCPLYSCLTKDEHIATFNNLDVSEALTVWVKELSPDPNIKWTYYKKSHEDFE